MSEWLICNIKILHKSRITDVSYVRAVPTRLNIHHFHLSTRKVIIFSTFVLLSGKMQEAIYLVTDSVSKHWRQLALKLGLPKHEIAVIEAKHPARNREKCMHALYRWRSMVALQEYKLTSIIRALTAYRLHDVAGLWHLKQNECTALCLFSGGFRIPLGGRQIRSRASTPDAPVSKNVYTKTKEALPLEGCMPAVPLDPPTLLHAQNATYFWWNVHSWMEIIGGSRGRRRRMPLPKRPDSFVFTY